MKEEGRSAGPWWPALALVAATLLLRLLTAPTAVDSLDAILFVRGLERYSVMEARPHWPGYPVYMAVGHLIQLLRGDAEASLRLVSILASSLSVWPLMALVRDWRLSAGSPSGDAGRSAVMAGLLWMLSPMSWLVGTEIGSDPLGLLMALIVLWLCSRVAASSSPKPRPLIAAGALAGVLLGVRLPVRQLAPACRSRAATARAVAGRAAADTTHARGVGGGDDGPGGGLAGMAALDGRSGLLRDGSPPPRRPLRQLDRARDRAWELVRAPCEPCARDPRRRPRRMVAGAAAHAHGGHPGLGRPDRLRVTPAPYRCGRASDAGALGPPVPSDDPALQRRRLRPLRLPSRRRALRAGRARNTRGAEHGAGFHGGDGLRAGCRRRSPGLGAQKHAAARVCSGCATSRSTRAPTARRW